MYNQQMYIFVKSIWPNILNEKHRFEIKNTKTKIMTTTKAGANPKHDQKTSKNNSKQQHHACSPYLYLSIFGKSKYLLCVWAISLSHFICCWFFHRCCCSYYIRHSAMGVRSRSLIYYMFRFKKILKLKRNERR